MVKSILYTSIVLMLVSILGCSSTEKILNPPPPMSVKTIREAKIGSAWEMKQLEITVGTEISIVLKLDNGDKVDGYFYLEKGKHINFRITGNSLIYQSKAQDIKDSQGVTSDRFSFVASQAQGIAYTLNLSNAADNDTQPGNVTIFLEFIYPSTGEVFLPIETD